MNHKVKKLRGIAIRRAVIVELICFVTFAATLAFGADDQAAKSVTDVVNKFHDALRRGDELAAMELLASDAIILESGSAETRDEYERHHLKEDIAFSQAVKSVDSILHVQMEGDAAWVISTSRTKGSFRSHDIDTAGTELVVLSKSPQGWRIRAIHWSSHDTRGSK